MTTERKMTDFHTQAGAHWPYSHLHHPAYGTDASSLFVDNAGAHWPYPHLQHGLEQLQAALQMERLSLLKEVLHYLFILRKG